VAQAEIALEKARTAVDQATLTAPVAGTVAAVGLTVGESSGSNGITIIGSGGATVTVDVPVASIPKVAVGQEAEVTPPGAITAVKGTVHEVGLLPTDTTGSSSAATYPVVVLVPEVTPTLASGARAAVSIRVGSAAGVVTVPNSAIAATSTTAAFVSIVKGGVVTRTAVTLGTVGPTRSEVSKGLRAGDTVLLADASEPIPTTNQNRPGGGFSSGSFTGSGAGGFPGGPGGGFSGGGAVPGGGFSRN
jgi:multidrug efflux pump subunit AcrA (membrane-fusion protein)